MMRLPENDQPVVLVDRADLPLLRGLLVNEPLLLWIGTVAVYMCAPSWRPELGSSNAVVVRRFFDRYYVLLPVEDNHRAERVMDVLFQLVADSYDDLVDRNRNEENIRALLGYVSRHIPDGTATPLTVADIGCGTGLALNLARQVGFVLIGIDRNAEMRAAARRRGMDVLDPQAFINDVGVGLAGAFASYVMHLGIDRALLRAVWSKLATGRVLAANFHKSIELDSALALFRELGADTVIDDDPGREHGPYAIFRKV